MFFDLSKNECFKFAHELYKKMKKYGKPVFLCVGSDKFVCDSLAPIVAETLRQEFNIDAYVYGGLDYNINANNLMESVCYVETVHPHSPIVLIDATLGDEVGKVSLNDGSFAGFGRSLPIKKIGTLSILGVVARKGKDFNLNSTRLKVVLDMARFISLGCHLAVEQLNKTKLDKQFQKMPILDF